MFQRTYEARKWERGFRPVFPSTNNRRAANTIQREISITTLTDFIDYINRLLNSPTYKQSLLTSEVAKNIMENLRETLQPLRINLTYESLSVLQTSNRIRFILSSNRYKADFTYTLVQQSNGLIFEIYASPPPPPPEVATSISDKPEEHMSDPLSGSAYNDQLIEQVHNRHMRHESHLLLPSIQCRLLALPAHDFNPNPKYADLANEIAHNKYTIYPIRDGTTFNLYWDQMANKWMMGTKNAFDISVLTWRGFTYDYIVSDVLAHYPDFSFNNLNKRFTYVIGMRHPAHHPFGQPQEFTLINAAIGVQFTRDAWLIQINNLDTLETATTDTNIGIPWQQPLTVVDKFYDLIRANEIAITKYLDGQTVFYGFVLRANVARGKWKTNDAPKCDYILESSLWHAIRHMIYQLPFTPNRAIRGKQEQNFKNMQYVIFDKMMNPEKRELFQILFPQFNNYIILWDSCINEAVELINTEMKSKTPTISSIIPENKPAETLTMPAPAPAANAPPPPNPTTRIAMRFLPIVRDQYQTTQSKEIDSKMIRFIILNPKTHEILFTLLTTTE